jgi:hypothetical protein
MFQSRLLIHFIALLKTYYNRYHLLISILIHRDVQFDNIKSQIQGTVKDISEKWC